MGMASHIDGSEALPAPAPPAQAPRLPDALSETDSFAEEEVQEPWKTLPVHPGHLWLPSSPPRSEVGESFRLAEELQNLRRTLLERFDHQDDVLGQLVSRPMHHAPSSAMSAKDMASPMTKIPSTVERKLPPVAVRSPVASFTPQGPQIFKSFSQFDLNLQLASASADSQRNKSKFATNGMAEHNLQPETQGFVRRLVEHPAFDLFFALIVIANSIFIGVEVQVGLDNPGPRSLAIRVFHYSFTALFTLELFVRLGAYGYAAFCAEDWAWMVLDAVIVATSLAEVVADILYALEASNDIDNVGGLSGLKAFRIIRITRIVKTVRLARIFRFVMALRMLVTSIMHTLKSLFWALMLLMLIVYVFSVLFVQAVNGQEFVDSELHSAEELRESSVEYFGSLGGAMLSLFMSIAGGVSWEDVLAPLRSISYAWVLCFLFYISFTYFAVLNVVTAVFCHSAIEGSQNDHANVVHSILLNKESHLKKMRKLFTELGADATGVITYVMFEEKMSTPAVREYFQTLGLDVWDAWSFFKLLDMDADSEVDLEEFLMGCLRLRGQARAVDVEKVLHDQTWLIKSQCRFQAYVETEMATLRDLVAVRGRTLQSPSPNLAESVGLFPRLQSA